MSDGRWRRESGSFDGIQSPTARTAGRRLRSTSSPDDGDAAETEGYGGDTEERVRLAAEAAEERMVDEVLALEKDVERARQEADELRSELERARELPKDWPPATPDGSRRSCVRARRSSSRSGLRRRS